MKKHISTFFLLILFFSAKSQNVGIGTNTPNQSAALEIKDTSRGILIPRMTMAQRIAIQNPGDGLIVYQVDSTKGFWYWDTEFWKFINSSNIASTGNSTQKIFYRYGFSSSANWICPSDVSQITVELWGAGGTSSPGKACIYNGTGTVNCMFSVGIITRSFSKSSGGSSLSLSP